MSREIKFRAWDASIKSMREVSMINWFDEYIRVDESNDLGTGNKLSLYGTPIMQYTGLKDNDNIDIYEGDIVEIHVFTKYLGDKLGTYEGEEIYKGVIVFESLGLFLETKDENVGGYLVGYYGLHEESFKVIGNIHQNPDLLK